jgi:hypothetical protein
MILRSKPVYGNAKCLNKEYIEEGNLSSTGRIFQAIKTATLNYIIQEISCLIVVDKSILVNITYER